MVDLSGCLAQLRHPQHLDARLVCERGAPHLDKDERRRLAAGGHFSLQQPLWYWFQPPNRTMNEDENPEQDEFVFSPMKMW
jgi:murein endopeptidase